MENRPSYSLTSSNVILSSAIFSPLHYYSLKNFYLESNKYFHKKIFNIV
jgi:hypothetical protein